MVTGIKIPVMLYGAGGPAGGSKLAKTGPDTHPIAQGSIKKLDEHTTYIILDPMVENTDVEAGQLIRPDTPGGDLGRMIISA